MGADRMISLLAEGNYYLAMASLPSKIQPPFKGIEAEGARYPEDRMEVHR